MARTTGPLMSMDASGTIAGTLTFAKWKGRNYVRQTVTPANPRSGLQVGMRAAMAWATKAWAGSVTTGNKATWAALAKAGNYSEFNAYVKLNQTRARLNEGWTPVTPPVTAGAEAAPTAGAVTNLPKSLTFTWTDSVGANDAATYVFMSTTTGFTPDISNLVAIIAHGVQTVTIPDLITGTPYYFRYRGVDKTGNLGTLAAQVTGTPT